MNRDMHDNSFNFEDDAQLNALLNEALSPDTIPGGIPHGLDARILVALPQPVVAFHTQELAPVIARIGFFSSSTFRRIAAAVVVAAGVGVAVLSSGVFKPSTPTQPVARNKPVINSEIEIALANPQADALVMPAHAVDAKIDQLRHAELANGVENWSAVANSLEAELQAMDDGEPDNG
jgi:hypothetical protein